LSFGTKRQMNSHLIAVEIGVVGGASQGVQLQSATFGEHGLKSLNAQAVKSGSTIEQNGMFFDDFFENAPNLFGGAVNFLLSCSDAVLKYSVFNERLEVVLFVLGYVDAIL